MPADPSEPAADGRDAPQTPGAQDPGDAPDAPARTPNALRVARHKRKLAAQGLRQLNVQVPVDAHDLLKALAQRLRAGEDPTAALFDLVAQQSAPFDRPPADRRIAPRPPLVRAELKNGGRDPAEDDRAAEARIGARVREILDRGGWRAALMRNLLS